MKNLVYQWNKDEILEIAHHVLLQESHALENLANILGESFTQAVQLILECKGRVFVTGMGKSGHICQKIAASLTSTGISSHFLHPAEGFHGDLGVLHKEDILIALSYSGETQEIINLADFVNSFNIPIIAITSHEKSTLAKQAKVAILLGQIKEADPYNLVPTTSTTLMLAIGDALTVALMESRKFTPEDFAVFHPKGMLGKRLTLQIQSLLQGEKTNPIIKESDTLIHALSIITKYNLGGTCVVDEQGQLTGIITDGDVRRIMENFAQQNGTVHDAMNTCVSTIMKKNPLYVLNTTLAYDALKAMENHQPRPIFVLPVVNEQNKPIGMVHLHSLVQAGFKTQDSKLLENHPQW